MATFADRLRELRKEKNLTQEALAKIFNITKSAVSKYETGVNTPDNKLLQELTNYFGVPVDYLLGRIDEREIVIETLSPHEKYALKIAEILQKEGLELNENVISDIADYAKFKLEQLKKQGS